MKVTGTINPLKSKIFVIDMDFGVQKTNSGIIVPSDDGKTSGIHPRWGQVWAIGPEQKDVAVGDWVLVEHGRWTRGIEVEQDDGSAITVRMVENDSILIVSDEKPNDVERKGSTGPLNFNIPGA